MDSLRTIASFLACTWLAWYMTGWFVTFALERQLVDIPNERSSHSRVTPRGGGVAFILVFLVATVLLGTLPGLPIGLPQRTLVALLAGLGVAMVGYLDDCHGVSIMGRLEVQLSTTAATLLLICGDPIHAFHYPVALIVAGGISAVILYTWLVNLMNFMDGIDGLAASQAVCVSGGCCLLILTRHGCDAIGFLFGILACATLGFLFWNWPSARIFMGDAGSYFLGFTIGALMALSIVRHELNIWVIPILLGVFVLDASVTLLNRMLRKECWYKPHRLHAFQHAADVFGHRNVTLSVMAITVCWLFPLAVLVEAYPRYGFMLLMVAWSPVLMLCYLFHSGEVLTAGAIPRWRTAMLIVNCTPKSIGTLVTAHVRRLGTLRLSVIRGLLITGLVTCSTYLAYITHAGSANSFSAPGVFASAGVFSLVQIAATLILGMHRCHWHLISIEEFPSIVGICLVSTLAGAIAAMASPQGKLSKLPASFYVVQMLFLIALVVLTRMIAASISRIHIPAGKQKRVIIYGANNTGLEIFSTLRRLGPDYWVVGYVDPRRWMKGVSVPGGTVLGIDSDIRRIATTYGIDDVLVSSVAARSSAGSEFIQQCRDAAVDVRILPSIEQGLRDNAEAMPVQAPTLS